MSVDHRKSQPSQKGVTAGSGRGSQWRRRAVMAVTLLVSCWALSARAEEPARYVGAAACSSCHQAETALWKTSHHAKAMQAATPDTVLGAFNGTDPSQNGTAASFSRSGDAYVVRTEGADGQAT